MSSIYIPSYNRAERVRTFEYLGQGTIVVPESQKKAYCKRYGTAVMAIPDKQDGSVSRKRNAILDLIEQREDDNYGWVIDDDLVALTRKKENIRMNGEETLEHLERLYIMAKDMQATYGGFDYSPDNMKLKDLAPFSLTKIMFGANLIKANDKIRYDERLRLNEDVEFFLQKMNSNRRVIKDNQYFAEFYGTDGAEDSVIKYDRADQRYFATMINNKWGYKAMEWKKTKFQFNHPIKGA
tara:strand:+ start:6129 stop:6845 length:717 start_codon:yes stop_codon:yes gene_type:complete